MSDEDITAKFKRCQLAGMWMKSSKPKSAGAMVESRRDQGYRRADAYSGHFGRLLLL
jgi:hypothetical protein